jgi:MFS family permease
MLSSKVKLSLFLCLSMCLGIGILRFSYTALLPSTRAAYEWTSSFASILSSANLLGYLIGAFWAMKLPQNSRMTFFIQSAAILGSISLLSCAFSGFHGSWYIFWRVISGISGGLLMILSPSVVAQCCDLKDRLSINFIGFSGIGIGVLLATLFMPYLDRISTSSAWLILFGFSAIMCAVLCILLQQFRSHLSAQALPQTESVPVQGLYLCLLTVYACSAFSYVPHSLFWIDYLSNTLHLGLNVINFNWILYGSGSALGAVTAYMLSRKLGNFNALKVLYSFYVGAIFIAVMDAYPALTFVSSFLTGLLNPAVVFLTSYTILQIYTHAYKKLWSIATLCFAITQLIGGLTFSTLQKAGVSYHQQFELAGFVLLAGTVVLFVYLRKSPPKPLHQH